MCWVPAFAGASGSHFGACKNVLAANSFLLEHQFIKMLGTRPRSRRYWAQHSRGELCMRKLILTLAAFAALGVALPTVATTPAEARTKKVVIIKKSHHDRGLHLGWRNRDRHMYWRHHHRDHPRAQVIVR